MEIWDAYYEDETLAGVDFIRDQEISKGLYHLLLRIQYQLNRKNFS